MQDQKQLREKRVISVYNPQVTPRLWRRQGKKSRQDLKAGTAAEAMEEAAYWRALHGLLSLFLIPSWTSCPGVAPVTMSWLLPHQSLIECWLQANLMEAFSQLRTPLPRQVKDPVKLTKSNQHITAPPADCESPSAGLSVYRYLLPPCRHDSHT